MLKSALLILYGLLAGFLLAGLILLVGQQPRGHAVQLLPTFTVQPVVVEVAGAVRSPGIYRLDPGSRLAQAVEAAGGFLAEADTGLVNQAARINDGDKIIIPGPGVPETTIYLPIEITRPTGVVGAKIINVNTASEQELETLPGIGPTRAKQICRYRQEHGLFDKIEDLLDVPGIGPVTFEQIKSLIEI